MTIQKSNLSCVIYWTLTHWDAMLGSKQGHLLDVFICNVVRDDQDGWIGVAQLIGAVDLTDGPALIWKALEKMEGNFNLLYQTESCSIWPVSKAHLIKQMLMCFRDILK